MRAFEVTHDASYSWTVSQENNKKIKIKYEQYVVIVTYETTVSGRADLRRNRRHVVSRSCAEKDKSVVQTSTGNTAVVLVPAG